MNYTARKSLVFSIREFLLQKNEEKEIRNGHNRNLFKEFLCLRQQKMGVDTRSETKNRGTLLSDQRNNGMFAWQWDQWSRDKNMNKGGEVRTLRKDHCSELNSGVSNLFVFLIQLYWFSLQGVYVRFNWGVALPGLQYKVAKSCKSFALHTCK